MQKYLILCCLAASSFAVANPCDKSCEFNLYGFVDGELVLEHSMPLTYGEESVYSSQKRVNVVVDEDEDGVDRHTIVVNELSLVASISEVGLSVDVDRTFVDGLVSIEKHGEELSVSGVNYESTSFVVDFGSDPFEGGITELLGQEGYALKYSISIE